MSSTLAEIAEGEIALSVTPESSMEPIIRAETDIQVTTAKRYPRSVEKAYKTALSMATLDEEIAASCMYALPRGGKTIEGPSIRLAEIMGSSWGNLRIQTQVIEQTDTFITARGLCWDLESNLAVATTVRRRITDKHGAKFNEDMIGVTSMAACAIAHRNAVFAVVPRAYVEKVYRECRLVAVGEAATLSTKVTTLFASFARMGVHPPAIFAKLGVEGEADITLQHLATLIGIASAIKSGETSVDDAFMVEGETVEPDAKAKGVSDTAAKAKEKMKANTPPATEPTADEPFPDDEGRPGHDTQETLI